MSLKVIKNKTLKKKQNKVHYISWLNLEKKH